MQGMQKPVAENENTNEQSAEVEEFQGDVDEHDFLEELESILHDYPLSRNHRKLWENIKSSYKKLNHDEKNQFLVLMTNLSVAAVDIASVGTQFIKEMGPDIFYSDEEFRSKMVAAINTGIDKRREEVEPIWNNVVDNIDAQTPNADKIKDAYPVSLKGVDPKAGIKMLHVNNMVMVINKDATAFSPQFMNHMQNLLEFQRDAATEYYKEHRRVPYDDFDEDNTNPSQMPPEDLYISIGAQQDQLILSVDIGSISACEKFQVHESGQGGIGVLSINDHKLITSSFYENIYGTYVFKYIETTNMYVGRRTSDPRQLLHLRKGNGANMKYERSKGND